MVAIEDYTKKKNHLFSIFIHWDFSLSNSKGVFFNYTFVQMYTVKEKSRNNFDGLRNFQ